jgi:hypothetical protein
MYKPSVTLSLIQIDLEINLLLIPDGQMEVIDVLQDFL